MVAIEFPDPESANEDGIVGIGGNLEPSTLIQSYSSGIFPWPIDDDYLTWFAPNPRAVLFFEDLKISDSLKKERKRAWAEIRIDFDFKAVIQHFAKKT